MGTTLWVLGKANVGAGDSWDHSAMFDAADQLDGMCDILAVPRLSGFFDWTDFNANLADEELPGVEAPRERASWFEARAAIPTLRALRTHIAEHPEAVSGIASLGYENAREMLIEELDDCIAKVEALGSKGERFHLCVVM